MKKIISFFLISLVLLSLLTGCSSKKETNNTNNEQETILKQEDITPELQEWIDLNKDNSLSDKEIMYYKPNFNKTEEVKKSETNKTDVQKISDTTIENIKKETVPVTSTFETVIEDGKEIQVEVTYPWTNKKEGVFNNLSGEFVYIITDNNIDAKYFITQLKIHQQEVEQGFSFTEEDNKKNKDMIKTIMSVVKDFYYTDQVNSLSYNKITAEYEKYIDNPSFESIEKDLNKMLTLEDGIYAMHLLIPTDNYTAIFEITYTGEGTLEFRVSTNEYIN